MAAPRGQAIQRGAPQSGRARSRSVLRHGRSGTGLPHGSAGRRRNCGSDFVPEMLVRARAKAAAFGAGVTFVEADALALPFGGGSFDLVSCSFGFRNLANYERGLLEIFRVLKPGGVAAILEFAEPRGKLFGSLFRFYFRRVLPRLGGLISGNGSAYTYLPNSVSKFPSPEAFNPCLSERGI